MFKSITILVFLANNGICGGCGGDGGGGGINTIQNIGSKKYTGCFLSCHLTSVPLKL